MAEETDRMYPTAFRRIEESAHRVSGDALDRGTQAISIEERRDWFERAPGPDGGAVLKVMPCP